MSLATLTSPCLMLSNRKIGDESPCFIVAELSCNHLQDLNTALEIARAAANAGADALKLQTYRPDTITMHSDDEWFRIDCGTLWDGQTLHDLYARTYTPWEWYPIIQKECERLGMLCFSSPFDTTSVDFLETHGNPCYKIASFEVCDHILLEKVARTGKPIILSSGVSDARELDEAVKCLKHHGARDIAILKCTSAYPARIEDANLQTIRDIQQRYGVVAGLSDHTTGIEVPITAVCLGARIVEKHLKLYDRTDSADDAFSLTPAEFKEMVSAIRVAESAIGTVKYKKDGQSLKNFKFKRSLFWVDSMEKGMEVGPGSFRSVRPSSGLHTRYHSIVSGLTLRNDVAACAPVRWTDFAVPSPIFHCRMAREDEADCRMIFEWRNDPITREMSHNTQEKDWTAFRKEYKTYFKNYPIIIEHCSLGEARPLGLVSFIRIEPNNSNVGTREDNRYLIALNLSPNHRGEGLGVPVLSSALHYFREHIATSTQIVAEIKRINTASRKTFSRCGFKPRDKAIDNAVVDIFEYNLI